MLIMLTGRFAWPGQVAEADVAQEPTITLLQAMELSQDRDSIAREYVTNFEITFEIGYPALKEVWHSLASPLMAVVHTYLSILSRVPDTLIERKVGSETARRVSRKAAKILEAGGVGVAG